MENSRDDKAGFQCDHVGEKEIQEAADADIQESFPPGEGLTLIKIHLPPAVHPGKSLDRQYGCNRDQDDHNRDVRVSQHTFQHIMEEDSPFRGGHALSDRVLIRGGQGSRKPDHIVEKETQKGEGGRPEPALEQLPLSGEKAGIVRVKICIACIGACGLLSVSRE